MKLQIWLRSFAFNSLFEFEPEASISKFEFEFGALFPTTFLNENLATKGQNSDHKSEMKLQIRIRIGIIIWKQIFEAKFELEVENESSKSN